MLSVCLSRSICVLWYVHRRLAERLHSENNCTGIEGERNAVLTVTPNVFRGNLQLEAHKVGISGEGEKSPRTHRCGGSRDSLLSPALSPLCLPSLIGTGFGVLALPCTGECVSLPGHTKQTEQANTLWGDLTQQPEPPLPQSQPPALLPKLLGELRGGHNPLKITFLLCFVLLWGNERGGQNPQGSQHRRPIWSASAPSPPTSPIPWPSSYADPSPALPHQDEGCAS